VGEVGAGEGYFTFKLAARVGKDGKIYANDIDQSSLRHIVERSRREGIGQITTIVGEVEDPLFPAGAMDLVIMVYVLHDLAKPVELLRNIQPALKPGAPLAILEMDPEKTGDRSGHFYRREKLLEIVEEAGFELVRVETFLSRDNVYIFRLSETEEDRTA
jgi:ubiquinone/menaquinone biosynthesis C-methylase UbiE